ncbi:MAG: class I SAM-dependent methyltransferase [Deferribacterales bacterium]|nr:class I SAM-dependent methyltransferase [Deferribacterales bacterium]
MKSELAISNSWKEFSLIDSGWGVRLEKWGEYTLVRPDPQAVWAKSSEPLWNKPDAVYHRSSSGGGEWKYHKELPESWIISYKNMKFKVRPTGFKHTGIFPEQAANWDWISKITRERKVSKTLNLFGYTGAATIASALSGSSVCHVDASKGAVNWCKENSHLSSVPDGKIRLIVDDCLKFVQREERRGKKYDGIIMDPPAFGRGAGGEVWKLQNSLWELFNACKSILSEKPSYILINSYTSGLSPLALHNIASDCFGSLIRNGSLTCGEIGLPFRKGKYIMPCGIFCRILF